jgi:restriction endonuclease Mrr/predicted transcriptional regulator
MQKGPLLSSEIIEELKQNGVNRSTIRQQLNREYKKNRVDRTAVTFGKGQYIYFLPNESETRIREKILQAIKLRKRLNRLFEALKNREIIPEWHAAKISGVYGKVPIQRRIESFEKLLADLERLELGKVVDFEYKSKNYKFLVLTEKLCEFGSTLYSKLKGYSEKLLYEETIINETISLLQSSGLGKRFVVRPSSVSVPVDALGDCRPYVRAGKSVSSKVMIEANTLWKLDYLDLEGLRDRVHAIRKELKVYSVIVYIIANLDAASLDLANTIGWKSIRPERLKNINKIENLRRQGVLLLKEASTERYRNIVREIRSIDDLKKLGNYRSEWFENIVRDFFDELGYHTRRRKKYYFDNGQLSEKRTKKEAFEIDVFGQKESNSVKEIIFCECKNWLETVDSNEINKFVKKLNRLYEYYQSKKEAANLKMKAFFIASKIHSTREITSNIELIILDEDGFKEYAKKILSEK